jgi:large subunit ribosomal protein L24
LRFQSYCISLQPVSKTKILIKWSKGSAWRLNKQIMKTRFKPKFNIKKGDTVVVIAGDDKDRTKPRKVLEVIPDKARVLVEGVNIITKHTKPTAQNTQGGIVKQEAPIAISNVMLWDAKAGKPTKVNRTRENGKLVRIAKKSGEVIK